MGWGALTWHILSSGVWSGCVATEVLFERVLAKQGKDIDKLLAKLHYYVDLCIELPMSIIAAGTGLQLMLGRSNSKTVHLMATLGTTAMLCNFACFYHVQQRYQASLEDNWEKFEYHDRWQHRVGKGVVHGVLSTVGLALYMSVQD